MKILLLSGGKSAEHEVSIVSSAFVRSVLSESGHEIISVEIDKAGQWSLNDTCLEIITTHPAWKLMLGDTELVFDAVFPVLHGPFGEDGTLQGLCRMAGWPCAGADVMTSALAMSKVTTKELVSCSGIPVLPWISLTNQSTPLQELPDPLKYPVFVKPARMGSSIGISKVDSPEKLSEAVIKAFEFDDLILIEKGLERAREIEVALLSESGRISSSVAGEIIPGHHWYDYTAKYECTESELLIPAPVPENLSLKIRTCAEECFALLQGGGFARADFLLDSDGSFYFNEINTIPGFTEISMFPKLWNASGISPSEVLNRILDEAVRSSLHNGKGRVID